MSGNYIPNFIKIHEKLIKLLRFEDVKKALIVCYVPLFFPFFNDFSHIFDIFLRMVIIKAFFHRMYFLMSLIYKIARLAKNSGCVGEVIPP